MKPDPEKLFIFGYILFIVSFLLNVADDIKGFQAVLFSLIIITESGDILDIDSFWFTLLAISNFVMVFSPFYLYKLDAKNLKFLLGLFFIFIMLQIRIGVLLFNDEYTEIGLGFFLWVASYFSILHYCIVKLLNNNSKKEQQVTN